MRLRVVAAPLLVGGIRRRRCSWWCGVVPGAWRWVERGVAVVGLSVVLRWWCRSAVAVRDCVGGVAADRPRKAGGRCGAGVPGVAGAGLRGGALSMGKGV